MKTYCCGPEAEKNRIAKKWERVKTINLLNNRIKLIAQTYLDGIEETPSIVLYPDGRLVLQWSKPNKIITLIFQPNEQYKDSLMLNNTYHTPVTIEKVKELLAG